MKYKVLVYSTLFPRHYKPTNGIFVAELVKSLSSFVDVTVLSPVPAIKNIREIWGGQRQYLFNEKINVHSPLYFYVPGILKSTDSVFMAKCSRKAFKRSLGDYTHLIHAHYAYPEAASALMLSQKFRIPLIVTVHGSDINVLTKDRKRKYQIIKTLKSANAIVAVADDLKKKVVELGISDHCVYKVPNGVDITKFYPGNKFEAKKKLGLDKFKHVLIGVGHLEPVKGFDRLIVAFSHLKKNYGLLLVGDGSERTNLMKLVQNLGIKERVRFAGTVNHKELVLYFHASDFLVISSHSEGWPTVIYEALACGVPVIANGVGGIPEAISSPDLGVLTKGNDFRDLLKGIISAYEREWDKKIAIQVAEEHSWTEIAKQYLVIYDKVLSCYSEKHRNIFNYPID